MSSGTLIFLLLVVGMPLAMMFMHRSGAGGHGMGGCGMGHGGQNHGGDDHRHDSGDEVTPVLGKPGERSQQPPTDAGKRETNTRHGCC